MQSNVIIGCSTGTPTPPFWKSAVNVSFTFKGMNFATHSVEGNSFHLLSPPPKKKKQLRMLQERFIIITKLSHFYTFLLGRSKVSFQGMIISLTFRANIYLNVMQILPLYTVDGFKLQLLA